MRFFNERATTWQKITAVLIIIACGFLFGWDFGKRSADKHWQAYTDNLMQAITCTAKDSYGWGPFGCSISPEGKVSVLPNTRLSFVMGREYIPCKVDGYDTICEKDGSGPPFCPEGHKCKLDKSGKMRVIR